MKWLALLELWWPSNGVLPDVPQDAPVSPIVHAEGRGDVASKERHGHVQGVGTGAEVGGHDAWPPAVPVLAVGQAPPVVGEAVAEGAGVVGQVHNGHVGVVEDVSFLGNLVDHGLL